jgi:predicted DNA-binding ribbon-helix-helix protein
MSQAVHEPNYRERSQYSRLKCIRLRNSDKLTAIRLEPVFQDALRILAYKQGICATDLIRQIEAQPRPSPQSLTSALRVYCMQKAIPLLWDT